MTEVSSEVFSVQQTVRTLPLFIKEFFITLIPIFTSQPSHLTLICVSDLAYFLLRISIHSIRVIASYLSEDKIMMRGGGFEIGRF